MAKLLPPVTDILRGSLVERYVTCGNPACKCARGERHGPMWYLTVTLGRGRTTGGIVGEEQLAEVRTWIENYHKLKDHLERISEINKKAPAVTAGLRDSRQAPDISPQAVYLAVFHSFVLRLPGFQQPESDHRRSPELLPRNRRSVILVTRRAGMKALAWLFLFSLTATPATAQHRGGFGGAGGRGGFNPGGFGPGRVPGVSRRFPGGAGSYSLGGFYPNPYSSFDGGYEYAYSPLPNVVLVQQPPPQVIVQQTPPPAPQLLIHDYRDWPSAPAAGPAPAGEETAFVIALTDGTRLSAAAVWVQDDFLHYADSDGRYSQLPLSSVDRASTRKLNQERKLDLRLPAPQSR